MHGRDQFEVGDRQPGVDSTDHFPEPLAIRPNRLLINFAAREVAHPALLPQCDRRV
jgi:hypothetical protein